MFVDVARAYTQWGRYEQGLNALRSAYAQLRHRLSLLAGTVAGLALVYLVPPVALVAGLVVGSTAAAVLLTVMTGVSGATRRRTR